MTEPLNAITIEFMGGPADGQRMAVDASRSSIWCFTAEITSKDILYIDHEYKVDHIELVANYCYK